MSTRNLTRDQVKVARAAKAMGGTIDRTTLENMSPKAAARAAHQLAKLANPRRRTR